MRKKMFSVLYVFLLILAYSVTNAQYPDKIFENVQPVWLRIVCDPALIDKVDPQDQTHWWLSDYKVKDSMLLNIYAYLRNNYGGKANGGYIENINLRTGKLDWSSSYYRNGADVYEFPSRIYINNNDDISVLGRKSIAVKSPKYKMNYREFDMETGNLLLEKSENASDSSAMMMYAGSLYGYDLLFPYGDDFLYLNERRLSDTDRLFVLDSVGVVKDTIHLKVDFDFPSYSLSSFDFVNQDTVVSLVYNTNGFYYDDSFDFRYYLMIMSDEFNKIDAFDITDDLSPKGYFSISTIYSDDKAVFLYFRNEPELLNWNYKFMIFDFEGKLLDTIDMNGEFNTIANVCRVSEDEFLIVTPDDFDTEANHVYKLRFYLKKIGRRKELLKEVNMIGKNEIVSVDKVLLMPDKDVVLFGYMNLLKFGLLSIYPLVVRFDHKDIWKGASKVTEKINTLDLKIYPNPVGNMVTVKFPKAFSGNLEVVDDIGRIIFSRNLIGVKSYSLDISGLHKGVYYIKAMDKHFSYRGVLLKK